MRRQDGGTPEPDRVSPAPPAAGGPGPGPGGDGKPAPGGGRERPPAAAGSAGPAAHAGIQDSATDEPASGAPATGMGAPGAGTGAPGAPAPAGAPAGAGAGGGPGHPDDAIPFRRHVGIRVLQTGGGRALLELPARPEVGNRFGYVHGGALATLVDGAMSNAILSRLPAGDRIGGTIELSIRFLEPAAGTLVAEGRVLRLGGRIAFAQADVRDADGRHVATAQGSYVLVRRPPEGEARPPARGRARPA
ncbi:PaaI family thioesterase [Thermaerobacter litoralis]